MKKLILLGLLLTAAPLAAQAATCTGGANCKACHNCSLCKHCAKQGGICSVCSGGKPTPTPKPRKKARR